MKYYVTLLLSALLLSTPAMADVKEDRQEIHEMEQKILTRLYKEEPSAKDKIKNAAGYATFSNIGVNLLLLSTGNGSGMVVDNASGQKTYMSMFSAGVGVGLGVKDFNVVFVFHDKDAMKKFIEDGWDFSGQADAAAKTGEKGGEGSAAGTAVEGVEIFQMTENGLALQATLQGTKYWKDDDLN
ncbi:YSC84-related protein [Thalassotalea euphylliae]|uniref:lipid-binding SYLF domain-containing protein n=1 Tax=Thalassotalea euphylliae TaxID=1655234 RepID=UPI003642891C